MRRKAEKDYGRESSRQLAESSGRSRPAWRAVESGGGRREEEKQEEEERR